MPTQISSLEIESEAVLRGAIAWGGMKRTMFTLSNVLLRKAVKYFMRTDDTFKVEYNHSGRDYDVTVQGYNSVIPEMELPLRLVFCMQADKYLSSCNRKSDVHMGKITKYRSISY